MEKPLTSSPRLRRMLLERIRNFGCGRVEVHTAVLEAVTNDAEATARLRAALAAKDERIARLQAELRLARSDLNH